MTDHTAAPESSGALSLEDAVGLLDSGPDDAGGADDGGDQAHASAAGGEDVDQGGADDGDAGDDQGLEAESTSADDAGEAEGPGDGDETEGEAEAAAATVKAPQWWSNEAKAKFAALPPELQAVVHEQEGKREAVVTQAKERAARAEQHAGQVEQLADRLTSYLPEVMKTFRGRWEGVDWEATLAAHGPEETQRLRFQFENETEQLRKLAADQAEAARKAREIFVARESAKLEGTPLADPKRRTEVATYLLEQGAPREAVASLDAVELTIAHKAMLWDQAQTKLKAKPPGPIQRTADPKKRAAPAVRPAASPGPVSPKAREAHTAKNRFSQTRSVDDAVALLDARG